LIPWLNLSGTCLLEVVVLSHTIEDPQDSLRKAVQDNFQQGVKYVFLVSKSQCEENNKKFSDFFKAIYTIAKTLAPVQGDNSYIKHIEFETIFVILPLSGEWTSWPYVLYTSPKDEVTNNVFVFRGNQRKEGIAEQYVQLDAIEAEAFLNAIKLGMGAPSQDIFGAKQQAFEPSVIQAAKRFTRRTGTGTMV
jgi:hypothetical protein